MKLRMQITKERDIRFISHLEYIRTIERAIRRAKLPATYSEGFNPHMKFSLASALGVGFASGVFSIFFGAQAPKSTIKPNNNIATFFFISFPFTPSYLFAVGLVEIHKTTDPKTAIMVPKTNI